MRTIEVEGVTKAYGSNVALNDVSFSVGRGETVALLGANGAGKSTLVEVLLGLRTHDSGRVAVLGGLPTDAAKAGRLGAMLQHGGLPDSVSVAETIGLYSALYPSPLPISKVLSAAGIEPVASRRLGQLSGGQAQRVRFALAITGDPEVVFLDEPTASLDVAGRRTFWEFIHDWSIEGRTVVFASHLLDEVESQADRVLLLQHGRLIADQSPAALRGSLIAKTITFHARRAPKRLLRSFPGVVECEVCRSKVTLRTTDADATAAALYKSDLDARDLEVKAASLDAAILELTREPA